MFTDSERERYQRHLQLPGFGDSGQSALGRAHIAVIGLGGLGCPASLYLAAAGVGKLTLVDGDAVSLSNLQRQVLFMEKDLGRNKATAARDQLAARNSDISITAVSRHLDADTAETLIKSAGLVIDCTDNFHTRYLINDICHYLQTPWVYGSVLGFGGQHALLKPGGGCFRCLFPELGEVPDCNAAGVLGAVPGTLGTLQALTAIRYLAGMDETSENVLFTFDGMATQLRQVRLSISPDCIICSGESTYRDRLTDYAPRSTGLPADRILPAAELATFLAAENPLLVDVRSAEEHAAGNLGGINIPVARLRDEVGRLAMQDRTILLYCQSGIRSATAAAALLDHDAVAILSLAGGMSGQHKRLRTMTPPLTGIDRRFSIAPMMDWSDRTPRNTRWPCNWAAVNRRNWPVARAGQRNGATTRST